MTEAQWLASNDPAVMLRQFTPGPVHAGYGDGALPRKLRLFACACCRAVWPLLTDDAPCGRCSGGRIVKAFDTADGFCPDCAGTGRINRSRRAVEVAERYADGEATDQERSEAYRSLVQANGTDPYRQAWVPMLPESALEVPVETGRLIQRATRAGIPPAVQAALIRCLWGNPWRPVAKYHIGRGEYVSCNPAWLHYSDGTVRRLAEAIYRERAFVDAQCECPDINAPGSYAPDRRCRYCRGTGRTENHLPILADALEEASCGEPDLLAHLRGLERCPACLGTATEPVRLPDQLAEIERRGSIEGPCETCHGRGWLPAGPRCGRCSGRGYLGGVAPGQPGWIGAPACPDCGGAGRLPVVHARGCWVLDLLLGKS